jgi:hypothetical protein
MTADYPTAEVAATPEYVLEVLRESVRYDFGDLSADDSVHDLAGMYNDLAWDSVRVLADCLGPAFDADIPLVDWRAAFPRARGRTVGEVCDFLAPRVRRPVVRPWRHVAGDCPPAGAFLTVRSILSGRGLDPGRVTPAAPVAAVPVADLHHLFWRLTLIEPGRVSLPREERAFYGQTLLGCLAALVLVLGYPVGLLLVGFGAVAGKWAGLAVGAGVLAVALAAGWVAYRLARPPLVWTEWPGISTFRDLAYCLAGQQPRRRIQPHP